MRAVGKARFGVPVIQERREAGTSAGSAVLCARRARTGRAAATGTRLWAIMTTPRITRAFGAREFSENSAPRGCKQKRHAETVLTLRFLRAVAVLHKGPLVTRAERVGGSLRSREGRSSTLLRREQRRGQDDPDECTDDNSGKRSRQSCYCVSKGRPDDHSDQTA